MWLTDECSTRYPRWDLYAAADADATSLWVEPPFGAPDLSLPGLQTHVLRTMPCSLGSCQDPSRCFASYRRNIWKASVALRRTDSTSRSRLFREEPKNLRVWSTMQAFRRPIASAARNVARRQRYGTVSESSSYASTNMNLRINKDTKVLFQGFTGKQGT